MKLILASQSPRRRELLAMARIPHQTATADCDEEILVRQLKDNKPDMTEASLAEQLAAAKARAVFPHHPHDLILAADTIVSLDGLIYGKPANRDQARHMLHTLSGRTHRVDTGVALIASGSEELFSRTSLVTFRPLSDLTEELIERYVETDLPLDKAGAYGIQELGGLLIDRIDGDFFSVMGLPIAEVHARIQAYGIKPCLDSDQLADATGDGNQARGELDHIDKT
ncbi:MAG: septum formation protein Maf [Clostridiaceae bacterium]|jgi:septum formation protein|nr:septum formation protein Maf [Clostridiaceae bacterium]